MSLQMEMFVKHTGTGNIHSTIDYLLPGSLLGKAIRGYNSNILLKIRHNPSYTDQQNPRISGGHGGGANSPSPHYH